MPELEQIDDRKFTINFGPQHPAAHGVLRHGFSRFILLVLGVLLGSIIAVNANAQMRLAMDKAYDDYYKANLYDYFTDISSTDILDCLSMAIASDEMAQGDKSVSVSEKVKHRKQSAEVQTTLRRALKKAGVASEEQITALIPSTKVAKVFYGKSLRDVNMPDGINDVMKSQGKVCKAAHLKAIKDISDFMGSNYDIVMAPPADNPYLVDRGNESLRGLFKSIVEYPPANARVTAQRCYMIPVYANTVILGDLGASDAPNIDGKEFGYDVYEEFAADINLIKGHNADILKSMPADPTSRHEAIDQPRNEFGSVVRTGTTMQQEMLFTALRKAMPDCVARAKSGLSKGGVQ